MSLTTGLGHGDRNMVSVGARAEHGCCRLLDGDAATLSGALLSNRLEHSATGRSPLRQPRIERSEAARSRPRDRPRGYAAPGATAAAGGAVGIDL